MPLEMDAIVRAFDLRADGEAAGAPWTGRVGDSDVTAVHIGMGPPLTRQATRRLLDTTTGRRRVDHVMIAGICGGLHPELAVGTLINPEVVVDHASGATYRHTPPGTEPPEGKLVTTEGVSLDVELSRRFFDEGCYAVDMETSAVAEVCEHHGCDWSVYRCIGDRYFDGLLDARLVALSNPDGSADVAAATRLLEEEPDLLPKLQQLSHDSTLAARLAAEAAVRGCRALDG